MPGQAEAAFDVLADGPGLTRWWPEVYKEVREVDPGDGRGRGRTLDLVARGRLRYVLRWRMRVVELRRPERIEVEATGDLVGRGVWTLRQDGRWVELTYDWQVQVGRPWMRLLLFLLRPVFAANHRWAMVRGEEGLRRELARRAEVAASPPALGRRIALRAGLIGRTRIRPTLPSVGRANVRATGAAR